MRDVSVFSFFSGSGFLDLGFESVGFKVDFVNEYHKPFLDAYKYSREHMCIAPPEYGYSCESVEELLTGEGADLLGGAVRDCKSKSKLVGFIGGPPCPDFSVGGKNKGKSGENGKLSQTFIDLIVKNNPDFFLFENVKGLWRTIKHREFYEQLKLQLKAQGYVMSDRLTNCIEFGVPQDRDRILLFGIKKELLNSSSNAVASEGIGFPWLEEVIFPGRSAFDFSWADRDKFKEDGALRKPIGVPRELTVDYWFKKNKVDKHPNSSHHFKPKAALPKFKVIDEGDVSKKSFKRLHRWRYSPTAAYGNNEVHLHPYKARRLSAAEALSIQSLPAEFSFPPTMTLSNMFKTIGNGVPYLMSRGVASSIKKYLTDLDR